MLQSLEYARAERMDVPQPRRTVSGGHGSPLPSFISAAQGGCWLRDSGRRRRLMQGNQSGLTSASRASYRRRASRLEGSLSLARKWGAPARPEMGHGPAASRAEVGHPCDVTCPLGVPAVAYLNLSHSPRRWEL